MLVLNDYIVMFTCRYLVFMMLVNAIVFDVTETRCKVFILYQQQSFKKPGADTPVATCQYSMEYNVYLLQQKVGKCGL